jgi:hypothetical protein
VFRPRVRAYGVRNGLQSGESRNSRLRLYACDLNQEQLSLARDEKMEGMLLRGSLFRALHQQISNPHQVVGKHSGTY